MTDILMDWIDDHLAGVLIALCALVVLIGVWAAMHDEAAWQTYAAAHHCHPVGTKAGTSTTAIGVGANGQTTVTPVYQPPQTIYACDAGEIEIR